MEEGGGVVADGTEWVIGALGLRWRLVTNGYMDGVGRYRTTASHRIICCPKLAEKEDEGHCQVLAVHQFISCRIKTNALLPSHEEIEKKSPSSLDPVSLNSLHGKKAMVSSAHPINPCLCAPVYIIFCFHPFTTSSSLPYDVQVLLPPFHPRPVGCGGREVLRGGEGLDMTPAGATSSPSTTAREARDDDVKDGDDGGDDGLQDRSDAVDNGHETGADGLKDGFDLHEEKGGSVSMVVRSRTGCMGECD